MNMSPQYQFTGLKATTVGHHAETHAGATKVVAGQSRLDLGGHIRIWKENLHISIIKRKKF